MIIDYFSAIALQFKLFLSNSYFVVLLLTSTTSTLLILYLYGYRYGFTGNEWLTASIVGMWASSTSVAGIINFQKYQGVMPYLMDGSRSKFLTFTTFIFSPIIFGLTAFPLSFLLAVILRMPTELNIGSLIFGILLLFFSLLPIDLLIAGFFAMTPRALIYEPILMVPVLIASNLFELPAKFSGITQTLSWIIPTSYPVNLILGHGTSGMNLGIWFVQLIAWGLISYFVLQKFISITQKEGFA
ncbi:MAG: hypothetical protein LBM27_05115 [Lactobacillaceae bacterium]|jgi:ABC-2 type transport system permease protein|nr:hypothetical protein [Lactobacillaceae bacterium]